MEVAETHVNGKMPPLIPRSVLFGNPVKSQPSISPDGKMLAYLAPSENGTLNVWIRVDGSRKDRMLTSENRRGIGSYFWACDSSHILYYRDGDGDENWHLFSIEISTGIARDLTPFRGVKAQDAILHPSYPHELVIGMNLRDRRLFDAYRIDLVTGAVELDAENPGDVMSWTADCNFTIRAATAFSPKDQSTALRVRDGKGKRWRDLLRWRFEEMTMFGQVNGGSVALGFSKKGDAIYVVAPFKSEMTALLEVNARTGKVNRVLASHPHCDVDMDPFSSRAIAMFDSVNGKPLAIRFNHLKPEWRCPDPETAKDFAALTKFHPGALFVTSRAEKRWVVGFSSDRGPTEYFLYDRARAGKKCKPLFTDKPALKKYALAPMEPLTIKSRDGLDLVSYLTLPAGVEPRNLPLVLLVHGGPWHRNAWGFDGAVQLLANRGYAVLQVNYRGSTGFGLKFLNAANGEWGNGKMMQDRVDAVKWAIDQGIADRSRIAIMGWSYGGYSTLLGLVFTPELFVCGVDVVGPSDVKTLLDSFPEDWQPVRKRWVRRIGMNERDSEFNKKISPLYHVEKIRVPLLIAHGVNDPRVKVGESSAVVEAMRAKKLPVTFVVYPDEGHGFSRPENNLDFFGRLEAFLAEYLGGRAEPWEKILATSAELW